MPGIEDHLSRLNAPQREAVEQTDGPVLVLAGAGSGKTRVITTRIAYVLAKGLASPSEILAVTFTNKAAGEMRERVAGLVGASLAKDIRISTFHSFCLNVLRAEIECLGYRRTFTIASERDARTLVRRSIEDMEGAGESFDAGMFLERIGTLKSAGTPAASGKVKFATDTDAKYAKWLPEVYERYQSALRAANSVDFDDLLVLTMKLFQEHPEVLEHYRERIRYVLVDEYQDTNGVQYALLQALAGAQPNLCVVGDDDQSIYAWRGANIANILNFERDYRDAKVVKLEQNYRSRQMILKAANAVIAHNRERRPKTLWSAHPEGRAIDLIITGDEEHEAKELVVWMKHIQSQSEARYSDFAVLYRSNQQSRAIEVALRQAGVPYIVYGGQEFYDRTEIRDIAAYLKALANPRDEAAILRIVNVPRRGVGDTTLHRLHERCAREKVSLPKAMSQALDAGEVPKQAEAGLRQFLGLMGRFRSQLKEGAPLSQTVHDLVDALDYRGELLRTCKSPQQLEARWANVELLLRAVSEYEQNTEKPTLTAFLDQSALAGDERPTREERRQTGVSLMTIHSAKGLEFPFVFLVGVEDGLLPHDRSVKEGGLEEERRLFYVAMTRAMRHLSLFQALSRSRHGKARMTKPSRFLAEIPREFVRERVRAAADMVEERVKPDAKAPKPRKKRRARS